MSLGLQRGTVVLVSYDSQWPREFQDEKKRLIDVFGDEIVAVEHFGSTAIPGMVAKPIIDINVAIPSLEDAHRYIAGLQTMGYEHMPDRWFDDRYFFPKGPEELRTHHLNLVEITSDTAWRYPLLFRDYLRTHDNEREKYATLKRKLAARYENDREKYTEAKSDFIKGIIQKALAEQRDV
jgi:GrpB-like predicted nucleotidyltransferase (UPF0157 family)